MVDAGARTDRIAPAAWWGLAVCTCATVVLQVDGTMVTAAVPALGRELGAGAAAVPWVLIAYFVPFAAVLLPGGALVDRRGARPVAAVGLGLFALGAVAGALAPDFGTLIASRVVQGVAAGMVSPAALAGAVSGFPPARRGLALGVWGAASGIVSLLGPLAGGVLTSEAGWRSNWWALLAVSAGVGLAIWRFAPRGRAGAEGGRDRRGRGLVVGLCAGLTGLTFLILTGGFLLGQEYLQDVAGESPLTASAMLLVGAVASAVMTPPAGWIADRRGERLPITAGLVVLGLGLALMGTGAVALRGPVAGLVLLTIGAGFGLLLSPVSRAALNSAGREEHGRVSAWLSVGRLAGAALGAGLAGIAAMNGLGAQHVRDALLAAVPLCAAGLIAARLLRPPAAGPG